MPAPGNSTAPGSDQSDLVHLFDSLLTRHVFNVKQWQLDIFKHVEFIDQVEVLENEADVVATQVGELSLSAAGHIDSVKQVSADIRSFDQAQDIHQG